MSLINQVLRDLDARHAPNVDRAALPGELRSLPSAPARSWWLPGLALAAAAAAWYLLDAPLPSASPQLTLPAVPVQAEAPAPATAAPAPVMAATEAASPLPALPPPPASVAAAPPAPAAQSAAPLPAPAAADTAVPAVSPAVKPAAVETPAKPNVAANLRLETKLRENKAGVAPAPAARTAPKALPSAAAEPPAAGPTAATAATVATVATAATATTASIDKRPRTAPANEAADAEYRKAMSALRRGAVSEAVDGLRRALRADRQHISARQALLSLLVEQQQWNEAQALIEEGLALDPAQTGWAMALARLQFEHGKLAEATETLLRHAGHAEQNADYQAFLALLLQKQKRPAEAAQRYRAALALKPAESRWWYGLGLVLESEQKPQEARAAFLKARETGNLSPEMAGALEQRLR